MRSFGRRQVVGTALVVASGLLVPGLWCGRGAAACFEGDRDEQLALAREVARSVGGEVDESSFATGSERFDGEWTVGTHQMAALGLAQVMTEHPETRDELLPALDLCIHRLLEPSTRAFGTDAWGEDGLEALGSERGHAYLGYVNLALGADRMVRPGSPHAGVHDRLTAALARRVAASPTGLIETYPGETYPPDVSAVVASIGLHGRATGDDAYRELLEGWSQTVRRRYLDPSSGLLFQAVRSGSSEPVDAPRASGTAIAAYFLSFSDLDLSRELFGALRRARSSFFGFGGILEYGSGGCGLGDIDSGPVLLGVGLSATGFTVASARVHGDGALYRSLYRTAHLFGAPLETDSGRRFVVGGPLGNAIMLAMLTAGPLAAEGTA